MTEIRFRLAENRDCDDVYAWRNHPDTRRVAFDPSAFSLETHKAWFATVLNNPHKFVLIAETDEGPVGVVIVDATEGEAWISIYVIPGLYGRGWGTRMLKSATAWLRRTRPDIVKLYAKIRPDNAVSLRTFEKAGYREHAVIYEKDLRHDE